MNQILFQPSVRLAKPWAWQAEKVVAIYKQSLLQTEHGYSGDSFLASLLYRIA